MQNWKSPFKASAYKALGIRRHYSGAWARLSLKTRQNHPLCQRCGSAPSVEVHHVVPLRLDPRLAMDPRNLLAVCRPCHEELER